MMYWEYIEKKEKDKLRKQTKSGLRKCPGHWIMKKIVRNNDCYEDNGKCLICGGWRMER